MKSIELSTEMQLLLACIQTYMCEENSERIQTLPHYPIAWDTFLNLVDSHRVYPIVHSKLTTVAGNHIPDQVSRRLKERCMKNARQALSLAAEMVSLVKLLSRNGIPVLPLRGPSLAIQIYGNLAFRHAGDLDLLVPTDHVRRVEHLLRREGYKRDEPDFPLSRTQEKFYTRQCHHFGYHSNNHQVRVELHWRWFPNPYLFSLKLEKALERGEILAVAGTEVKMLSQELTLLFLCAHGAKHGWSSLFWLCDVARIIHKNHALIDWENLITEAASVGAERPLTQGICLSNLLIGTPLPEPVLAYYKRDRAMPGLVKIALQILSQSQGVLNPPFTSAYFSKKLCQLRLNKSLRYKFFACRGQMNLTPYEWRVASFPDVLFPLYYALRPFTWFLRWRDLCRVRNENRVASSARAKNPGAGHI